MRLEKVYPPIIIQHMSKTIHVHTVLQKLPITKHDPSYLEHVFPGREMIANAVLPVSFCIAAKTSLI